jgi:NAD-dependent dihydropyrimidine dehydrogenase PreA subunit
MNVFVVNCLHTQTLMDPERRATYDALAGFSASSINPFADTSLPADQVFVDEYTCIGCRNCTNVCPKCVTATIASLAAVSSTPRFSPLHCLCHSYAAVFGCPHMHGTADAAPPANTTH